MNSSERRLKLMLMLQQGRDRKTVQELADYFDVSKRTMFRDFNALQEINVPITWDKYSGYGVMPGFKIPPLMFSSQELATIIVGLNFVKSQIDARLVEDAKGVEVKIQNVLPDELKNFMASLQKKTVVDPYMKFGSEKKESDSHHHPEPPTLNSLLSDHLPGVEFLFLIYLQENPCFLMLRKFLRKLSLPIAPLHNYYHQYGSVRLRRFHL